MSDLSRKILLKQVDDLTREEKIELIDYLTRQIENQPIKTESRNLVCAIAFD